MRLQTLTILVLLIGAQPLVATDDAKPGPKKQPVPATQPTNPSDSTPKPQRQRTIILEDGSKKTVTEVPGSTAKMPICPKCGLRHIPNQTSSSEQCDALKKKGLIETARKAATPKPIATPTPAPADRPVYIKRSNTNAKAWKLR